MRPAAAWIVLALALAGCSGGGDPASLPDGATATTGVLRGIVVDDAVRPLADARIEVTADGVALNASTDQDGGFRFTGLDPGTYVVEASKPDYAPLQMAVVVLAGVDEPELARLQLVFEPRALPFAQVYKHEGYFECGSNIVRVCANVNIATWLVLCGQTGGQVCPGNVTSDRSVFFVSIDGLPSFIQAELDWDATSELGKEMGFLVGGGTEEELKAGVGLPAYNYTSGPSPLMVRVTNHEGPGAWCRNVPDPPCTEQALNDSRIGDTRALLGQLDAGPTVKTPVCTPPLPVAAATCGAGWSMLQSFTLYTSVFYGYEPPLDWLFTQTGATPPPPPR